jgi:putative ABC transport system permease protein
MRSLAALKMLLHDRSTTAGSVLGVISIVFLVGQQLSVLFGLFNYMSVLVDHSGADIWVCTQYTANINGAGSMPVRYVDRISGLPDIEWVEPLVFGSGSFRTREGQYQPVQVVGVRNPRQASGPWRFYQGTQNALFDYEGITVDRLDISVLGTPQINNFYEIGDIRAKVLGITQSIRGFAGTLIFTNMVKAAEILKQPPGRCKAILVKVKPGVDVQGMIGVLRKIMPRNEVLTTAELSQRTRAYYIKNTGIGGSFGFSTLMGALVGIIIIMLTMYTSVLNRTKEFAVLRALGARKIDILIVVVSQSLIIAAIGIIIGFFFLALFLSGTLDSKLPSYMPRWIPIYHAVFTLVMALLGSLLAMRKAIKIEPATVFR